MRDVIASAASREAPYKIYILCHLEKGNGPILQYLDIATQLNTEKTAGCQVKVLISSEQCRQVRYIILSIAKVSSSRKTCISQDKIVSSVHHKTERGQCLF